MLKTTVSFIASALIIFNAASTTTAATGTDHLEARAADIYYSPTAKVCSGPVGVGCITIPIHPESCINFTGGLSFLNKEVTSAVIPPRYECTFFAKFGCLSDHGGADQVTLTRGTWSFFFVPGTARYRVNFNDIPSSFICTAN